MSRSPCLLIPLAVVLALGTAGAPSPAMAADSAPMSQAMARERDKLFETLKSAPDERSGRQAENAIWQFWVRSAPTPEIEARLTEAMRARSSYDFETARGILDEVIRNAPDYAEGWNQRAFILFLQNKPDKSLEDIDRCLELEPRHFGALAGKANILMMQGRVELAQKALRQAIDIHPWLKERRMLLEPKGEKI